MARMRNVSLQWTTLYTNTTTVQFQPASGWMDASRVAKLRATVEVRERTGSITVTRAYQTCDVRNSPNASVIVGSAITTNTLSFADTLTDVSANTGDKQLVRLGYQVQNTTGSTLNVARVQSQWTIQEPT